MNRKMTSALAVPVAVLAFPMTGPTHAPALAPHAPALQTVGSKVDKVPAGLTEFLCTVRSGKAKWTQCETVYVDSGERLAVRIASFSQVKTADFLILRGRLTPLTITGVSAYSSRPRVLGKNNSRDRISVTVFAKGTFHGGTLTGWFYL